MHPAKRSKPLSIQHLRLVSDKVDCIVISASSCQCTVWSAKAVRRSLCHDCVVCAVGPSHAAIAVLPFLEIWSFGELPNCRNSQYSDFYDVHNILSILSIRYSLWISGPRTEWKKKDWLEAQCYVGKISISISVAYPADELIWPDQLWRGAISAGLSVLYKCLSGAYANDNCLIN